ncbi:MAG: GTP-binding protein [Rhodospirillales bacterium]|nr:MAG: GTP-binding protein [Rhodospirillales bacterium]
MSAALPVTVIGGYLGAGKTTLVNHLLRHAGGRRIAVMVNDFGALAVDADLIEAERGDVLDIAGGCVCCSYGSDLMAALMELPRRRPDLDHVALEASGVALPGAIASAVRLLPAYALDGVVVVADAETVRARAADRYIGDTIDRQLAAADLVMLNKTDLVAPDAAAATARWIETRAPGGRVVATRRSAAPVEVVLGARTGAPPPVAPGMTPGGVDAASLYDSFTLRPEASLDLARLGAALTRAETGLLRAKGWLRDGAGALRGFQLVGARWEVADAPATARAPGLVFIGLRAHLDRDAVTRAIDAARVG